AAWREFPRGWATTTAVPCTSLRIRLPASLAGDVRARRARPRCRIVRRLRGRTQGTANGRCPLRRPSLHPSLIHPFPERMLPDLSGRTRRQSANRVRPRHRSHLGSAVLSTPAVLGFPGDDAAPWEGRPRLRPARQAGPRSTLRAQRGGLLLDPPTTAARSGFFGFPLPVRM